MEKTINVNEVIMNAVKEGYTRKQLMLAFGCLYVNKEIDQISYYSIVKEINNTYFPTETKKKRFENE